MSDRTRQLQALRAAATAAEKTDALRGLEQRVLEDESLDEEVLTASLELLEPRAPINTVQTWLSRVWRALAHRSTEDRRRVLAAIVEVMTAHPHQDAQWHHATVEHLKDAFERQWGNLQSVPVEPRLSDVLESYAEQSFVRIHGMGRLTTEQLYERLLATDLVDVYVDKGRPAASRVMWARRALRWVAETGASVPSGLFWPDALFKTELAEDYVDAIRHLAHHPTDSSLEALQRLGNAYGQLSVDAVAMHLAKHEWTPDAVETFACALTADAGWDPDTLDELLESEPFVCFLEAFGEVRTPRMDKLLRARAGESLTSELPDTLPFDLAGALALVRQLDVVEDLGLGGSAGRDNVETLEFPAALVELLSEHDGVGRYVSPHVQWPQMRVRFDDLLGDQESYGAGEGQARGDGAIDPRDHGGEIYVVGNDNGNPIFMRGVDAPRLYRCEHDEPFTATLLAESPGHLIAKLAVQAWAEREVIVGDALQRYGVAGL